MNKKPRALLLLSGGLDSTLVGAILKRENIEVLAIRFVTGLEYSVIKKELLDLPIDDPAKKSADMLNIPLRVISLKDVYLNMFFNPKYGYGSAINPCLDCHILMLKEAKKIMDSEGFDFVATGEVKGQRPMSQKSVDLDKAVKDSGLTGYLLRPLSALKLEPTEAEKNGLIDRKKLYGITGRGREAQIKLAAEFGIDDYPTPAGAGCSIVDKGYARRYFELTEHQAKEVITIDILRYLAIGRHFRLSNTLKLILGRNYDENKALEKRNDMKGFFIKPNYDKGPNGFIEFYGEADYIAESELLYALKIIGHFSKEETENFSMTVFPINFIFEVKSYKIKKTDVENIEFTQIL